MYELVYCSFAKPDLDAADITAILKTSQENNVRKNITGCLLYYKHEFIQMLEGEPNAVKELFSTISNDARHSRVIVLAEGEKQKRVFSGWSMAYHTLSDEDARDFTENVFVDNFITFSKMAEKRTFPTVLFWSQAALLLKK